MSAVLSDDFEIYQLLYCSLASEPMGLLQTAQLLDNACRLNKMDHITGLLMVHDGIYVQWLEGPTLAVTELWARLRRDKRHHCVVKLLENREAEERSCPDWSMRKVTRDELLAIVRDADKENRALHNSWGSAVHVLRELLEQPDTHHYITARHKQQDGGI